MAGAGWLLACASQQKQVGWIHTNPGVDVVASFIRVGVSAPTSRTGETLVTSVSVALGVMLTLLTLSLIARRATRPNAAILLAMWVLPPLIVCAAAAAGKDIFVERYFTPSVIGMALMLGYGLTRTRVTPMNRPGFGGGCHSTRGWTAWQHHGSTRQSFKSARHVSRSKLAKIRNGDEEQYAGWPSSSV